MIKKLSDICSFLSGNAWKSSEFTDEGIPIIRINNLNTNDNDFKYWKGDYDKKFLIYEGDLLVSLSGTIKTFQWNGPEALLNQRIVKVIANPETNQDWVYYQISNVIEQIANKGKHAVIRNVSVNDLKNFEVDVPDFQTQNKIVAILDKARALVQKRQKTKVLLDELLRAQFLEMIGNPTISEKYKLTTLSTYLEKVQIGPFGSQLHRADYVSNEIPLINPINIIDNKIEPDFEVTIKKSKYVSLPNYHLKTGDIIMARRGEMGRCGIISEKENGWFCGTGSLYLRPKDTRKAMFLLHCITNRATVEYLNHNAKGVTMKNLNKTIIANIPIVDCPEEVIIKFNAIVEKYDKIRLRVIDNLQQIENLFYSVLQKAFSGKLNLDVSILLDALLEEIDLQKPENDIFSIVTNEGYLLNLVKRLNNREFESQELYDKAKHVAFQLLKEEELIAQGYDEESKCLKLIAK
ncbi:restriction endonuclease subunit S [Natronoflexus pectinivorans]|uniref:Type I restriction enzyme S subunit n=1 Tax=Natronoflexus pectinivorans TaxID=682526 RepID=A0A4R2G3I5_9BACT|nr:restriction endonuclease subunit S [Natronoflexus pectinivorans]TCO02195.1 type I restriction enzyme S subunit [Natronoflexus pectinivorans]